MYGKFLSYIRIPDDAKVYVEHNKCKATKIEIVDTSDGEGKLFTLLTKQDYAIMLAYNGDLISYIKTPPPDLCALASRELKFREKYKGKLVPKDNDF